MHVRLGWLGPMHPSAAYAALGASPAAPAGEVHLDIVHGIMLRRIGAGFGVHTAVLYSAVSATDK